jgi:predicted RNA-binding protein
MKNKEKILVGGDSLFFNPSVKKFNQNLMKNWISHKEIALFLGCTKYKPYSSSMMHKKVIGLINKYEYDPFIQQYIIGEPLVAVPREWETNYPAAHYEFPPNEMTGQGRDIFVERLTKFFVKIEKMHTYFVVFTPNHHRAIALEASDGIFTPIIVAYNIFQLPNLLKVLKEILDD